MSLAYGYNRAEENASPYDVSDTSYDGKINHLFLEEEAKVYSAATFYKSSGAL